MLVSSRSTLQKLDQEAVEGKTVRSGSDLFQIPEVHRQGGKEAWYDEILGQNKLLFTADYVKKLLNAACQQTDRSTMEADMQKIIAVCRATGNRHFGKFASLVERPLDRGFCRKCYLDFCRGSGVAIPVGNLQVA